MIFRIFAAFFILLVSNYYGAPVYALEGGELFVSKRCVRCHTIGRGRFVGPDLKAVFDKYPREKIVLWITNPSAVYAAEGMPVNEGYPPMPRTDVSPEDAEKIADYLFSLNDIAPVPPDGVFVGRVINETTGSPAAGMEVSLGSFMGDRPISILAENTGEDGGFIFEGLSWGASHKISIQKDGVLYETDKMVFQPGQKEIRVSLPVYETTKDDRSISLEFNHLIVEPFEDAVRVAELAGFVNSGKVVVVSDENNKDPSTLRLGVPAAATNLNFIHRGGDSGDVSEQTPAFTLPMLPGSKTVLFSYEIPFSGGIFGSEKAVFTKTLQYDTASFVVLSPALEGVRVEGLGDGGRVSGKDGKVFINWEGGWLKKGDKVKISVSLDGGKRPVWFFPFLIFTFVLTAAVLFRVLRGNRSSV